MDDMGFDMNAFRPIFHGDGGILAYAGKRP